MRKNKKLIVIISVVLILAIASAVFAYLYLMTDIFKSNKELFAKYFGQNEEMLQKITDLKTVEVYKNLKNENKYESNTNIKISYSEGGEISNPLNNLTAKFNIQKDNQKQYTYVDSQILYDDEEYLETEFIKEQDVYGIRFPYAIQQFITAKNDENITEIMSDIGLTTEQSEDLINLFESKTNNNEKINTLKNKYFDIVKSTIVNGEFSKQKNAIITYNNNTVKANAYTVLLSSKQVENMLIEILNNVKNEADLIDKETIIKTIDETINKLSGEIEIPEIKITVYEYKQNTIRTVFDIDRNSILIENMEQNQELKTKIQYSNLSDESLVETEISISRTNYENEEKFEIIANITEGDDNYIITFSNIMQSSQGQMKVDTNIGYKQDITEVSMVIEKNVNIGQDFEKNHTLENGNSRSISSLEKQKREEVISKIKEIVAQKTIERTMLLAEKMEINNNENENKNVENEISQVEINKFNAKFEFYTGEEVSAENVKMLLDVVKNNISSYEFLNSETPENSDSIIAENNKVNIKLNIEKDKTDEEGINKILEKIDTNKKYKVSINYKEPNGLIEYINITEI